MTALTTATTCAGTVRVPLTAITVGDRLRPLDEVHAASLAANIQADGLLVPIIVREEYPGAYRLLAGRHRLRAYEILGEASIPADVRASTGDGKRDELLDELVEIGENMRRKGLSQIEHGKHLLRDEAIRAELDAMDKLRAAEAAAAEEKARTGAVGAAQRSAVSKARTRLSRVSATDRRGPVRTAGAGKFSEDVAATLGKARRTIDEDKQIAREAAAAAEALGVNLDDMVGTALDTKQQLRELPKIAKIAGTAAAAPLVKRAIEFARHGAKRADDKAGTDDAKARSVAGAGAADGAHMANLTAARKRLERDGRVESRAATMGTKSARLKEVRDEVRSKCVGPVGRARGILKGCGEAMPDKVWRRLDDLEQAAHAFVVSLGEVVAMAAIEHDRAKAGSPLPQPIPTQDAAARRAQERADQDANAGLSRDAVAAKGAKKKSSPKGVRGNDPAQAAR